MAAYIVSKQGEIVEVEPQVPQVIVRIAGLTVIVQRAGTVDEPTVSASIWSDPSQPPAASIEVPAPADLDRDPAVLGWYLARQR
jgi:hypothetical protein